MLMVVVGVVLGKCMVRQEVAKAVVQGTGGQLGSS